MTRRRRPTNEEFLEFARIQDQLDALWEVLDWMVDGAPPMDALAVDPRRFGGYADRDYRVAKATECFGLQFGVHYPFEERPAGRLRRVTPIYDAQAARGAVFGCAYGWERPNWFAADPVPRSERHPGSADDVRVAAGAEPGPEPRRGSPDGLRVASGPEARADTWSDSRDAPPTFGRPAWREAVAAECRAVRDRAGLVDLSALAKFEIAGADATAFVERLGANRPPRAVGRIGLTHVLTEAGGVASELTITRLAVDRYYLTSAAAAERHDQDVLRRHAAAFADVEVVDHTDRLGVLGLAGPESRTVLGALTDVDLDDDAFPWLSARAVRVAGVEARALRISYVGELGWELHVAMADLPALHEALWAAGAPVGLAPFGAYATSSMRLEKGYRAWGVDLTTERTPIEAGLGHLVRTEGREFTGRDALLAHAGSRDAWRMALLSIEPGGDADPFHTHTVWKRGQPVGIVTSGAPGHRTGTVLALAYLRPEAGDPGASDTGGAIEVSILGRRSRARALDAPPYDPANARLRGGMAAPSVPAR